MPTIELTLDQIVDAVRRLPKQDQRYVLSQLVTSSPEIPRGRRALKRFDQLRESFRMQPRKEARMAELLSEANARTLSEKEQLELERLLEESHTCMLELALAVMMSESKPNHISPENKAGYHA